MSTSTASPRPPPDVLAFDLPCIACGYNLRGLAVDGYCPECGAAVAQSLLPGKFVGWDQGWLRSVREGAELISASAALVLGGLAALIVLLPLEGYAISPPGDALLVLIVIVIGSGLLGSLLSPALLALPGGPWDRHSRPDRARRRTLYGLLALAVGVPLAGVLLIPALPTLHAMAPLLVEAAAGPGYLGLIVGVWAVTAVRHLRYVAILSEHWDDELVQFRVKTAIRVVIVTACASLLSASAAVFVRVLGSASGMWPSLHDLVGYLFVAAAILFGLGLIATLVLSRRIHRQVARTLRHVETLDALARKPETPDSELQP